MKRLLLIIITAAVCLPVTVIAQGIEFFKGDFRQALEKAGTDNKHVVIDCYTDWCGPCKRMDRDVFTQEEVGNYVNPRFVFLKSDMEKGEGIELRSRYDVRAYPTFLVLSAEGREIYRFEGGMSPESFIIELKETVGEIPSFEEMARRYVSVDRDKAFMRDYIYRLMAKREDEKVIRVAGELMSMLSDEEKSSPDYWFLYENFIYPDSDGERYLIDNRDKFIRSIGEQKVTDYLAGNCASEYSRMLFFARQQAVTEEQLAKADQKAKMLGVYDIPMVVIYRAGARMCYDNDADAFLYLYENISSELNDEQIAYFGALLSMIPTDKFSSEQKKRLGSITNK